MKQKFNVMKGCLWIVAFLFVCSCAPGMMRTGFVDDYDNMRERQAGESLPSFYHIEDDADLSQYKKVVVHNFYALTTGKELLKPGHGDFSNLQKNLADNLARYLQSNGTFEQCTAVNENIRFDDIEAIRQLDADAVLMANIADFRTSRRGVSDQFEFKLIDIASGKTVMTAIDNNSTEMQAVAIPLTFERVLNLIKIGKGQVPMPSIIKDEKKAGYM